MKIIIVVLFASFISSCTSIKTLENSNACTVWKEQILFGPTYVTVGNNRASWSGQCKNLWWNCNSVNASFDPKTSEIFLRVDRDQDDGTKLHWDQDKTIGKITGSEFYYSEKNPLENFISYTAFKANPESLTVTYQVSIHPLNLKNEVVYHYNKVCSTNDALLGVIAVGAVENLKSKTSSGGQTH